ncbi:MAG TPA: nuclear transport factor 2 family protein [Terracidiphilus sp.]|nr:nuclear transport factor 2 family protein [Terracidiphilus sp.]
MSGLPVDVAMDFVRAINRQDVDALTALMTPDHRFTDSLGNAATGREGMRNAWTLYFQMVPDYSLKIDETYVQDSAVILIGSAGGTYSHAFEQIQSTGMPIPDGTSRHQRRWQTPAALRALIHEGKVAEWRVYADNEPLRKLMREGAEVKIP